MWILFNTNPEIPKQQQSSGELYSGSVEFAVAGEMLIMMHEVIVMVVVAGHEDATVEMVYLFVLLNVCLWLLSCSCVVECWSSPTLDPLSSSSSSPSSSSTSPTTAPGIETAKYKSLEDEEEEEDDRVEDDEI